MNVCHTFKNVYTSFITKVKKNKITCDKLETISFSNKEHYSEACNNNNQNCRIESCNPVVLMLKAKVCRLLGCRILILHMPCHQRLQLDVKKQFRMGVVKLLVQVWVLAWS